MDVEEILLKLKQPIKPHSLIVGDFNTPLSPMDRSSGKRHSNEIRELTDVMTQMDLTGIFRTFHPNEKEYMFFSTPHETCAKIDHIPSNKANLNRYKKCWNNPLYLIRSTGLKVRIQQH